MRLILTAIILALGAIEGIAWWWMNPAESGTREPVLAYRPSRSAGVSPAVNEDTGEGRQEEDPVPAQGPAPTQGPAPAQGPAPTSSNQQSKINNHQSAISPTAHRSLLTDHPSLNFQSPISNLSSPSSLNFQSPIPNTPSITPLPELYTKSAPMLRCSSGEVFHVAFDDRFGVHCAFFAWDGTDTGSVLEAFRHMPEACMGSIGMKLVSKEKPIAYQVGLDRPANPLVASLSAVALAKEGGARSQRRDQEPEAKAQGEASPSSSDPNQKSNINNHQSSISSSFPNHKFPISSPSSSSPNHKSPISNLSSSPPHPQSAIHYPQSTSSLTDNRSPITDHRLTFHHTVFQDPGQGGGPLGPGPLVHTFRAVWVSGTPTAVAHSDLADRSPDQLRSIRLTSALNRHRPRHARVIQGAVRGTLNAETAWAAFEQSMLRHLRFED